MTKFTDDQTIIYWTQRNLTEWEKEKDRIKRLNFHKKRNNYRVKNFVRLKKISLWRDYYHDSKERLLTLLEEYGPERPDPLPLPYFHLNRVIRLWYGDITELEIDAFVNVVDKPSDLSRCRGVNRTLLELAGPLLEDECKRVKECPVGEIRMTGGYYLPARRIIHTPRVMEKSPKLLTYSYNNCLEALITSELYRIALPATLADTSVYPLWEAAHVAIHSVRRYFYTNYPWLHAVVFTVSTKEELKVYETLLQIYCPFDEFP